MIKYLELAVSQEVYKYLEELDEINWSARGNVLNQYLRNTSFGTTVTRKIFFFKYTWCFFTNQFHQYVVFSQYIEIKTTEKHFCSIYGFNLQTQRRRMRDHRFRKTFLKNLLVRSQLEFPIGKC
jgi:hypothetical protein